MKRWVYACIHRRIDRQVSGQMNNSKGNYGYNYCPESVMTTVRGKVKTQSKPMVEMWCPKRHYRPSTQQYGPLGIHNKVVCPGVTCWRLRLTKARPRTYWRLAEIKLRNETRVDAPAPRRDWNVYQFTKNKFHKETETKSQNQELEPRGKSKILRTGK